MHSPGNERAIERTLTDESSAVRRDRHTEGGRIRHGHQRHWMRAYVVAGKRRQKGWAFQA